MEPPRYLSLAAHLKARFGQRVQKVPLDAGGACPNRDGLLSTRGCAFCNPNGSGSGLAGKGMSIAEQWGYWIPRLARKYKARAFLAYLQSFTCTYRPLEQLEQLLAAIRGLPDCVGLCIGARPDCLEDEKLDLLASMDFRETWIDMGLQSSRDDTLRRINRGHDAACFAEAVERAAGRDLAVCAHVIAGLPGEGLDDLLNTIRFLNGLPVRGIKLHNLYICQHTAMARLWADGEYRPLSLEEYAECAARAVELLRGDVVVHRLTGDPAPGELLAPGWAGDKSGVLQAIRNELEARDVVQGRNRNLEEPS